MKALKKQKIVRIASILAIMMLMSFVVGDTAHSWGAEKAGHTSLSASPGYLNAVKAKTDYILNQTPKKKSVIDKIVDYVESRFSNKLSETADEKMDVELKKKTSSGESQAEAGSNMRRRGQKVDLGFIDPETAEKIFTEAAEGGATVTQLDNGKVVSVWKENNSVYLRVADINDPVRPWQIYIIEDNADSPYGIYVSGVTDLGDGRFAATVRSYYRTYVANEFYESKTIESIRVFDMSSYGINEITDMRKDNESYYKYNYRTRAYHNYGTSVSNLTSLGNGEFAMGVRKYDYSSGQSHSENYIAVTDGRSLDFENGKKYDLGSINADTYAYRYQSLSNIVSLGGGDFAVSVSGSGYDSYYWRSGTNIVVMNSGDSISVKNNRYIENVYNYDYETGDYEYSYQYISKMISVGNGDIAIGWTKYTGSRENGGYNYDSTINISTYDISDDGIKENKSYEIAKADSWYYDGSSYSWGWNYLTDMKALDDGSIVVALNSYSYSYDYNTRKSSFINDAGITVINSNGQTFDITLGKSGGKGWASRNVTQITSLGNGTFGVVFNESYTQGSSSVNKTSMEQFTSDGTAVSTKDQKASSGSSLEKDTKLSGNSPANTFSAGKSTEYDLSSKSGLNSSLNSGKESQGNLKSSIEASVKAGAEGLSTEGLLTLINESLAGKDALAIFSVFEAAEGMDVMAMLANILKDPTDAQKKIIDIVKALLTELEDMRSKEGATEELEKVKGEFVQMVAAALLAQAMPDLLKEKDVTAIKSLFSQLEKSKAGVMAKYKSSMEACYAEIKKTLAKNISTLRINNIVSKELTEKELEDLPPSEIDRILERIKRSNDKDFAMKYILQQEEKYRQNHIEASKDELEKDMKAILSDFTHKMSAVLSDLNTGKDAKK